MWTDEAKHACNWVLDRLKKIHSVIDARGDSQRLRDPPCEVEQAAGDFEKRD